MIANNDYKFIHTNIGCNTGYYDGVFIYDGMPWEDFLDEYERMHNERFTYGSCLFHSKVEKETGIKFSWRR